MSFHVAATDNGHMHKIASAEEGVARPSDSQQVNMHVGRDIAAAEAVG